MLSKPELFIITESRTSLHWRLYIQDHMWTRVLHENQTLTSYKNKKPSCR